MLACGQVKREMQRVTADMESYAGQAKYLKQAAELSKLHVVLEPLDVDPPPAARPPRAWRVVQRSSHQLQSLLLCIVDGEQQMGTVPTDSAVCEW